jgi:hypothetical protein
VTSVTMRTLIRLVPAALLGVAAALLVSCGSSGSGLIPAANAGPLQSDFEAVARAAQSGNGSCAATESALGTTEQDFLALPATVDRGLRATLQKGIANLHTRALAMCAQPTGSATTTTSTQTTTATTPTTTTSTQTTPTTTTTTTPTSTSTTPTTTSPSQGGGTPAPGESSGEGGVGPSSPAGGAGANSGGSSAGGASAGGGQ